MESWALVITVCFILSAHIDLSVAEGCTTCDINNNCFNTCRNGASCTPVGNNDHSCTCVDGFFGTECEKDPCYNYCKNGGTCTRQPLSCQCLSGYDGPTCSTVTSTACLNNPCLYGGTCVASGNSYTCTCAPGYSGTNCATAPGPCYVNPCQSGGQCIVEGTSYRCQCLVGYSGTNCETSVDTGCPTGIPNSKVVSMCSTDVGVYTAGEYYLSSVNQDAGAKTCQCFVYGFQWSYEVFSKTTSCSSQVDVQDLSNAKTVYCAPGGPVDAIGMVTVSYTESTSSTNDYCVKLTPSEDGKKE